MDPYPNRTMNSNAGQAAAPNDRVLTEDGWKDVPRTPGSIEELAFEKGIVDVQRRVASMAYLWMCFGLAATGGTAFAVSSSPEAVEAIFGNRFVFYGLLIFELVMVWQLAKRVMSLPPLIAKAAFLAYSVVNGLTFAIFFLLFELGSVGKVFLITAGAFAALSLFGFTTKKNLSAIGGFCMFALFGLIIAMIVNMFMGSAKMDYIISVAGVLIFAGLIAWDTQKLKLHASTLGPNPERVGRGDDVHRVAVLGALDLYLDFINMFIFLLRLLGDRK